MLEGGEVHVGGGEVHVGGREVHVGRGGSCWRGERFIGGSL